MKKRSLIGISVFLLLILTVKVDAYRLNEAGSFAFSDSLKQGDKFIWDVSVSNAIETNLLSDNTVITLKVLKDMAGVKFDSSNFTDPFINSNVDDYFDISFSTIGQSLGVNVLIFPTSLTFSNGTTINPIEAFWLAAIITDLGFENENVTISVQSNGDLLSLTGEFERPYNSITATSYLNATINKSTGVMESYNLVLDIPFIGNNQTVSIVKRSDNNSKVTFDTSDSSSSPINLLRFALPLLSFVIYKRKIKK